MKKRIYLNFLGLSLLSVLLLSVSIGAVLYHVVRNQEKASVRDRAYMMADLMNSGIGYNEKQFTDDGYFNASTARLTVISPDGTVLLDNKAYAATMENHSDREEFKLAMEMSEQHGESIRYSTTMGGDTYYFAIRLHDGNVLRVSKAMESINGVFIAILPALFAVMMLVFLIANIVSRRLTDKILRPLNDIDFDGDNTAVYDELIPYAKKIDQQKRIIGEQIETLRRRAETIEAITGNMKEGLILLDKAGTVLLANKSAADIFNEYSMAYKSILHVCRDTVFQQGVKQCLSGTSADLIMNRNAKTYSVYFSPVYGGEAINGGAVLLLNITERYEAEKQRREFSANVSHELKTPLTSISALAELIVNGMAKQEDIQGFAEKITVQTQRLIILIEDIIRLSEFDEGKAIREATEFDLYDLTESVVEVLREKVSEKSVTINIAGERLRLTANRRMIDELLYNLIDNAIKYNKEGGTVTVTLSRDGGSAKIAVADTGIGIPKEHKNRVFERFYRVDASRNAKTGGTGLGLSIVKHIAAHHGGSAEIDSIPGEGTTVSCWLAG